MSVCKKTQSKKILLDMLVPPYTEDDYNDFKIKKVVVEAIVLPIDNDVLVTLLVTLPASSVEID